jgi:hypothetical protein
LLAIVALSAAPSADAGVILFEDFEDGTVTYTSSLPDAVGSIGDADYSGIVFPGKGTGVGSKHALSFSNVQGNAYYAVQKQSKLASNVTLTWSGIDISNHSDLEVSFFLAEDDRSKGRRGWRRNTSFRVEANVDGKGFASIFAVEPQSPPGKAVGWGKSKGKGKSKGRPLVDTDFDGFGDGREITNEFTKFSAKVVNGSLLDLRVVFDNFNTTNQGIAFDSFSLSAAPSAAMVPEPTSLISFLGIAGLALVTPRRRRS